MIYSGSQRLKWFRSFTIACLIVFNYFFSNFSQEYKEADFTVQSQNGNTMVSDMKKKLEEILQNKIQTIQVSLLIEILMSEKSKYARY